MNRKETEYDGKLRPVKPEELETLLAMRPPLPELEPPICPVCGGSGGGDDPAIRCAVCNGTGDLPDNPTIVEVSR